jgi:hypothetical protein
MKDLFPLYNGLKKVTEKLDFKNWYKYFSKNWDIYGKMSKPQTYVSG